jgi:hypothetical protein
MACMCQHCSLRIWLSAGFLIRPTKHLYTRDLRLKNT